jgi:hypothetical protein
MAGSVSHPRPTTPPCPNIASFLARLREEGSRTILRHATCVQSRFTSTPATGKPSNNPVRHASSLLITPVVSLIGNWVCLFEAAGDRSPPPDCLQIHPHTAGRLGSSSHADAAYHAWVFIFLGGAGLGCGRLGQAGTYVGHSTTTATSTTPTVSHQRCVPVKWTDIING